MDLQEPHIGIPQCWQGLHHCTVPRIVPWLLRCLLVLLLCYCFMQSTPLFTLSTAYAQDLPLVVQEIRYRMPDAGEVFLVWGIDGWVPVLEEIRPTGTILKNGVMHTPMDREGDTFVAKVQVPLGTAIDYGFLITKTRNGAAMEVREADGDPVIATQDGMVEVQTMLTLAQGQITAIVADVPLVTQEIRYHMPEAGEVFLVWGIDGWILVPEEVRPAGTVLKKGVMHTLMDHEGDTFVAQVRVPAGTTIGYGFLIKDA